MCVLPNGFNTLALGIKKGSKIYVITRRRRGSQSSYVPDQNHCIYVCLSVCLSACLTDCLSA